MEIPFEFDQRIARAQALKALAVTPQHAAAEGAMDAGDGEEVRTEEVRRRIQHQADPLPPGAPEVAHADLAKIYNQAVNTPTGYPPMGAVNPEAFSRGPIVAGEAAHSPGYDPSARPVPVPQGKLNAAAISRPLMTGGQSRPSAEG